VATVAVHVTPRAGRDEIAGWRGSELAVRVTTAPEAGKANAAVCEVIASALHVPKSAVRVVRGATSRHKVLDVDGVEDAAIRSVFGQPEDALF